LVGKTRKGRSRLPLSLRRPAAPLAVNKQTSLSRFPPLTNAVRRFFAPHSSHVLHCDSAKIKAPLTALTASAAVLREANCSLSNSLRAVVNERGSVNPIVAAISALAASYTLYLEVLTTMLKQSFPRGGNLWLPFKLTPTSVLLAIHSLPVTCIPHQDKNIFTYLSDSFLKPKGLSISSAWCNTDHTLCLAKRIYSVFVNVEPHSTQVILPSIYLYGSSCTVKRAYTFSLLSQCQKCRKSGHMKP